jgi:hypothetical protein
MSDDADETCEHVWDAVHNPHTGITSVLVTIVPDTILSNLT